MPRLSQLRLVSIGHPQARFDDVTIDLRGPDGRATDTTLWLRNGGGKSSLLNLFFALVRPNLRDFLGAKANEGERKLLDYVTRGDHAVVVAEWELDTRGGIAMPGEEPERFLTGVFMERSRTDTGVERHFFAARVNPRVPELSITGLPLTDEVEQGRVVRRSLATFLAKWRELDRRHPGWDVQETKGQDVWERTLDSAGIDPALYGYQLRMNQREGGADDLFKFRDADSFVDFFLELVIDPADGERICQNITKFRDRLRDLNQRLIPEQEFTGGLRDRLTPLADVAASRTLIHTRIGAVASSITRLDDFLRRQKGALVHAITDHRASLDTATQAETVLREGALRWRREAAAYRIYGAEAGVRDLQGQIEKLQNAIDGAEYDWRMWDAAVPFRDLMRAEAEITRIMKALETGREEDAPLLHSLREAAVRLHARLRARSARLRSEESALRAEAGQLRVAAREARENAGEQSRKAGEHRGEAGRIERRVAAEARERAELVRQGALSPEDGAPTDAAARLRDAIEDADARIAATTSVLARLGAEDRQAQEEQREVAAETATAEAEQTARDERLNRSRQMRGELAQDPILLRHLGTESVDLDRLDLSNTEQILRRAASSADDHALDLKVALAEGERALRALEATHLLPPSRDVERVVIRLREERINASSGWEFAAATMSDERADVFVRTYPALANGVLVRDQDYERAVSVLRDRSPLLDAAVLVAPHAATVSPVETVGTVFGPGSTALYRKETGLQERLERERRQEREQRAMETARNEAVAIRSFADRLRAFRGEHPAGWFAAQEEALRSAQEAIGALKARLVRLKEHRRTIADQIQEAESRLSAYRERVSTDGRLLGRVEAHLRHHDFDPAVEHRRSELLCEEAGGLEEEAFALRARAQDLDDQAERIDERARSAGEEARVVEQETDAVDFLPEGILGEAETGDVESARAEFLLRRRLFTDQAAEPRLRAQLEVAQEKAENARRLYRKRFDAVDYLTEHDIRVNLGELEDPEQADMRRDEAIALYHRLTGSKRAPTQEMEALVREVDRLKQEARELQPLPPIREFLLRAEADRRAQDAGREAAATLEAARVRLAEADELRVRLAEQDRRLFLLDTQAARLNDLTVTHASLLARARPTEPEPWVEPRPEDVETRIGEAHAALQAIVSESAVLDGGRTRHCSTVRAWMGDARFAELKSSLRNRIHSYSDEDFEHTAADLQAEIRQRLAMVEEEIREESKHKKTIVSATLAAAEEGIRALESAARRSRIPDHLPGLGGHDFLQITISTPTDVAEREARVSTLIDRIISETSSPDGLKLVQQAVRRLGGKIGVRVLFPDPDARPRWVTIVEMAKQSGGERLTSAVLLFCSLARMRAARRGQRLSLSSTLLLDNPIGTASRTKLIELQRDVARAMGIQLFYTTGVDDLNAVGMLDRVVRLKNERRDRWSGECLVEIAEPVHQIEAATLHLGERSRVSAPEAGAPVLQA